MNSSRKKISRKNYFPRILCFPSAMSHICKSTKMRIPGNRPEMAQLHKNTISSKMVIRGWYMTYFDHRDLLNSKKLVWDGFHNFPDLYEPICDFSRFFRGFRARPQRKTEFLDLRVRKKCSKINFFQVSYFSHKIRYLSSILVYLHRAYP